MRPALPILFAFLLVPSFAAAEGTSIQAIGGTMGWDRGVTGFQWDNEGAVGVRYWINGTRGETTTATVILTTCATPDSHAFEFCKWTRLMA